MAKKQEVKEAPKGEPYAENDITVRFHDVSPLTVDEARAWKDRYVPVVKEGMKAGYKHVILGEVDPQENTAWGRGTVEVEDNGRVYSYALYQVRPRRDLMENGDSDAGRRKRRRRRR